MSGKRNPQSPSGGSALEWVIVPRARDLGGFEVRRALPSPERQRVGPFIFFDQIGPAQFLTGQGIDVRPHPHIGLATVTYLYEGSLQHRDSLGSNCAIDPGEVNWMVAGRGITHSERTAPEVRARSSGASLFGIQTWVALPQEFEGVAPEFHHHAQSELPLVQEGGASLRLILGSLYGARSPVKTFSQMFYADARLEPHASLRLTNEYEDRGAYVVEGQIEVGGTRFDSGRLLVFRSGEAITLRATRAARLMLLGGEPLSGPRYLWWNFVSSSLEKIEEAKRAWREADWQHGRFRLPPDDREEFTPAPDG